MLTNVLNSDKIYFLGFDDIRESNLKKYKALLCCYKQSLINKVHLEIIPKEEKIIYRISCFQGEFEIEDTYDSDLGIKTTEFIKRVIRPIIISIYNPNKEFGNFLRDDLYKTAYCQTYTNGNMAAFDPWWDAVGKKG